VFFHGRIFSTEELVCLYRGKFGTPTDKKENRKGRLERSNCS
jgi:hypothetical protein